MTVFWHGHPAHHLDAPTFAGLLLYAHQVAPASPRAPRPPAIPFLWLNTRFKTLQKRGEVDCVFAAAFGEPFDDARHATRTYTAAQFALARETVLTRPAATYRRLLDMIGCTGRAPCETRERCAPFDADFGARHDKDGDFEELWAFVFPAARSWGGTLGAVPRENDPEPVLRAFLAKEWCAAKGRGANAVAQWCY